MRESRWYNYCHQAGRYIEETRREREQHSRRGEQRSGKSRGRHGKDPVRPRRRRRCGPRRLRRGRSGRRRSGARSGTDQRRDVGGPEHRLPAVDRGAGAHLPHPPARRLLLLQALLSSESSLSLSLSRRGVFLLLLRSDSLVDHIILGVINLWIIIILLVAFDCSVLVSC